MPEPRSTEEWIEAYLNEELSYADRLAFVERLQNEPALAEALQEARENMLVYQVADRHAEKEELREMFFRQEARVIPMRNLAFWAIVAATVVMLLVVSLNRDGDTDSRYLALAEEYYEPYPLTFSRSGEQAGLADQITTLYQQGEYAGAIPLLEQWAEAEPEADIPAFYLGQCYYQNGQDAEGLGAWQSITESSPYYEQARWYSVLSHLQLEEVSAAQNLLQEIVAAPLHYHQQEARALLEKLE